MEFKDFFRKAGHLRVPNFILLPHEHAAVAAAAIWL
jgi:hypothetical protein